MILIFNTMQIVFFLFLILLNIVYFGIIYIVGWSGRMNNKGQALVEFVLVLPVLMLIIFGMIELGNVIYQKYELEKHAQAIVDLYNNEAELIDSYKANNNLDCSFDKSGNLVTLTITKKINLITPGLTNFLGNPFEVKVTETFYTG